MDIFARSVRLLNGGVFNTESTNTRGDAGFSAPITIIASNTLQLDQGAIQIRTETANGGNMILSVGRLFDLHDSKVTTSLADGTGSGGDIFIKAPLMVLDSSRIEANALRGSGGNIFALSATQASEIISTPDSVITASGNITITAPNTDVSSSLAILPETFFDVSSQLRETCAARGGRPASSFAPSGRGGLPPDPGAPLAANSFGQPLEQQTATGSPTPLAARPPQTATSDQTDHGSRNSTAGPRLPTPHLPGIAGWCHQQDLVQ